MDSKKIGAFIKRLRQDNNMSQNDLAKLIPINREAISKWECGRTIPDSSTILILSKIFKVSADEIMCGEYKNCDNKQKIDNISLILYDDRNLIKKKLNKISKILLASIIFILFITTIFLSYYFFNSYDSVKIYTLEAKQDEIYLTDGTIMLTGDSIYFRLGNINGIDENKISKVTLYYKDDNGNKKIIYESTSAKDELIRDFYDYNEYFEIKDKNVVFNSLFIDVCYTDNIKTIELIMNEDYSNKRLFFTKKNNNISQKAEKKVYDNNQLINSIKEKFDQVEDNIYFKNIKIKQKSYDVRFIDETSTIFIYWENNKYNYSITYDINYKNVLYNKKGEGSDSLEECNYEKDNEKKITCDSDIINILNSIINTIYQR